MGGHRMNETDYLLLLFLGCVVVVFALILVFLH